MYNSCSLFVWTENKRFTARERTLTTGRKSLSIMLICQCQEWMWKRWLGIICLANSGICEKVFQNIEQTHFIFIALSNLYTVHQWLCQWFLWNWIWLSIYRVVHVEVVLVIMIIIIIILQSGCSTILYVKSVL